MATFLLGVGAQKAGTTWLHRYLSTAPAFARGAMKEYHVWDSVCAIDEDGAPLLEGAHAEAREDLRLSLVAQPERYFEHFAALLAEPGKTIAADITPAYSALPEETLRQIRGGFDACGIALKAVFLMRDPVERCWSAARMYRRKGLTVAGFDPTMAEADFVRAYAGTPHAQRRGRYERTVANLESVLPADHLFFGFYETLFDSETIARLCAFLEIDPLADFERQEFNVSPKAGDLPRAVRSEIAYSYEDTLSFCADRFPETRDLWRSFDFL